MKSLEEAEQRLAEAEALARTLGQVDQELADYHQALERKLAWMTAPSAPAPLPAAAPFRQSKPASGTKRMAIIARLPAPHPPTEPEPVVEIEAAPVVAADEGARHRAAPRRQGNPVQVHVSEANGEPIDAWVVDRSAGGLRILIDQAFKVGAPLTVRPAKAHAGFPWIKIEVRSCSPERGSFSLGCMFVQKPSWAELQGFG